MLFSLFDIFFIHLKYVYNNNVISPFRSSVSSSYFPYFFSFVSRILRDHFTDTDPSYFSPSESRFPLEKDNVIMRPPAQINNSSGGIILFKKF